MTLALYKGGSSEINRLALESGLLYDRIPVYRSGDPKDEKYYTKGGIQKIVGAKDFEWCYLEIEFKVAPTYAEVNEAETLRLACLDNTWIPLHNCKGCEKCGNVPSNTTLSSITLFVGKSIRACLDCKAAHDNSQKIPKSSVAKSKSKSKSKSKGSPKAAPKIPMVFPESYDESDEESVASAEIDFKSKYYQALDAELASTQHAKKVILNNVEIYKRLLDTETSRLQENEDKIQNILKKQRV
jgi:hypothetical protein